MDPLEMARNSVRHVEYYAEVQNSDPLSAHLHHLGERGHQAAQIGACMALISMASDLRAIRELLGELPVPAGDDPVIAQARATRDHMRAWGAGEQTHDDEKEDE